MFKSASSAVWLGRRKERKVLELCKEHIDKIVKTVGGMRKTIHAFCELDTKGVNGAFREVFAKEREADDAKRGILEELSKGIFHPINREEIIRLIMTAEDVADNAKEASRKLNFISPKKLGRNLRKALRDLSDNVLEAAELMNNAFLKLTEKPAEALQLAEVVERAEEMVDDLRVEALMPEVLSFCDRSKSPSTWLMLKEVIDNMENVADRCEDVADIIRGIAISSA